MLFFIVERKEGAEDVPMREQLGRVSDDNLIEAESLLEAIGSDAWERAPLGAWLVDFRSGLVRAVRRRGHPEVVRRGAAA